MLKYRPPTQVPFSNHTPITMSSTTTSFAGNFPQYSGLQVNGLADTDNDSPSDGDVLKYSSTTGEWVNQAEQAGDRVLTVTTDATAGARTYTAAEMINGLVLRDPAGAARSDVTATAAALVAAFGQPDAGASFSFFLRNTADADEALTLTGGTGVTISGTGVAEETFADEFTCTVTNAAAGSEAVTCYDLGTLVW